MHALFSVYSFLMGCVRGFLGKIVHIVKVGGGIWPEFSRHGIILFCSGTVTNPVIADTQLDAWEESIAVQITEAAIFRCGLAGSRQFEPEDCLRIAFLP